MSGTVSTLAIVGVKHLGRVIALHFARQGWEVVCASRTAADVEALARDVDAAGGKGVPVVCDLLSPESLKALARPLDLVVASQSGGGRFGPASLLEYSDEDLARALAAYVTGTWNLLRAVGPTLLGQKRGTFLQMGTSSGVRTKEGFAPLGATQHALRALVQVAAKEWRPSGVHVAYVAIDGGIESEKTKQWLAKMGVDKALPPEEIAKACDYLHGQQPRAWTHELVLRPSTTDWTAPT